MISKAVKDLVSYGLKTGLLKEEDAVYARNPDPAGRGSGPAGAG